MPRSLLRSHPCAALVALLAALVLLLPSCSGADTPAPAATDGRPLRPVPDVEPAGFVSPPSGSGLARYEGQALDWKPCQDLLCARVLVPLDYRDPDGQAITLSLAKRAATGPTRLGTLFINPGGPGGSGVGFVSSFRRVGLEGYDVVGWDPRGVGQSTPVGCSGFDLDDYSSMDTSPDDPTEQSELLEANRELGLACLKQSGPLLEHISTVEVARDLDVLRGLVGDDKLNLFGASYGTQIGATYAQLFPARVGRMVLDGAVDITDSRAVSQAEGFDRALRAFADWCAGRQCSLGSSQAGVLEAVRALWTRLDSAPIKVGRRELTQQLAVAGVVNVLYANADAYKYLLQALQGAIDRGDGRFLLFLADQLNQRNDQGTYGQLNFAFPAVRCLDEHDLGIQGELDQAAQDVRAAPTIGPFVGP
ncbi:MAG: alpha/beta fold hydrolase, partial [Propionibacteriaceae bacterium]